MLDDAGYGQAGTFADEIETATRSRLVDEGDSYNAFHTAALCSPTGAALLTGRNRNRVGFDPIAETDTTASSPSRLRSSLRSAMAAATRRQLSARITTRRRMPWATGSPTAFP